MRKLTPLSIILLLVAASILLFTSANINAGSSAMDQDLFIEFEHVASLSLPASPYQLEVIDNYVFVAARDSGVHIIDVSDLEHPTLVGTYDTPGWAYDVAVEGNVMYIADYDAGLQIADITDPSNPKYLGYYDVQGLAWDIVVENNVAYLGNFDGTSYIIDVTNPSTPTVMNPDKPMCCHFTGLQLVDHLLYATSLPVALGIIDVSDLSSPNRVGLYEISWNHDLTYALRVVDDLAYVASIDEGLLIIDVSDPTNPEKVSSFDTPGEALGVDVQDKIAYVTNIQPFQIIAIDVSDEAHPKQMGTYLTSPPFDIKAVDGNLFVAANRSLLILHPKKVSAVRTFLPVVIQ